MQDGSEISNQPERQRWGTRGTAGALFAGKLTFENVSCTIGTTEILKNLSFELQAGEIACLLGQSGCGKTTLLRIAAGIQRPTSGRVLLDDEEVDGPTRYVPPERRNVGLVFQDFALFPHLTVIENVSFGLNALSRKEAAKVAEHALARVGLASFRHSYPSSLSGGEQQRVALARAIVPRPQVMLMDEPFSGLDQRLRETVREETLALLQETRATCVLVTHDPVEAMDFADRILLMRAGRLIQTGTSTELFNKPADLQVARFFSDVNELGAVVKNGNVETPLGTLQRRRLCQWDRGPGDYPSPGHDPGQCWVRAPKVMCWKRGFLAIKPGCRCNLTGWRSPWPCCFRAMRRNGAKRPISALITITF